MVFVPPQRPEQFNSQQRDFSAPPVVDMSTRSAVHQDRASLPSEFPTMELQSMHGGMPIFREHTTTTGETFRTVARDELNKLERAHQPADEDKYISLLARMNGYPEDQIRKDTALRAGMKLLMPGLEEGKSPTPQQQELAGARPQRPQEPARVQTERTQVPSEAMQPQPLDGGHGGGEQHGGYGHGHGHGHGRHHGGRHRHRHQHHRQPGNGEDTGGDPPHGTVNGDSRTAGPGVVNETGTAPERGQVQDPGVSRPQGQGATMRVDGPPTMSARQIDAVLAENHSPAAGMGQKIYDMGVQAGINPAVALAMFGQESSYGKAGAGARTHNPGNIRSGNHNRQYADWDHGFKAMFDLMSGHGYVGGGRNSVGAVISKWAPPNENHTAAYVHAVSNKVIAWSQRNDDQLV